MKKTFKKYFIPHHENEYKPHLLREAAVFTLAGIILLLFIIPVAAPVLFSRVNFLASIISPLLVDLANEDRTLEGITTLSVSPALEEAARMKAEDMASKGYFAHTSPEGKTPWYWFEKAGYVYTRAGENLAVDFVDSSDVNKAWLASPTHRANIMNSKFTEIGIATAEGIYQGRTTIFVVQMFGAPAAFAANIAPALPPLNTGPEAVKENRTPNESVAGVESGNETFIAVTNSNDVETEPPAAITPPVVPSTGAPYRMLANPRVLAQDAYILIAFMITITLGFMVGIEIEKHHMKHILYGVMLLTLIGASLYIHLNYYSGVLIL